jgi:rare lipoprotein A
VGVAGLDFVNELLRHNAMFPSRNQRMSLGMLQLSPQKDKKENSLLKRPEERIGRLDIMDDGQVLCEKKHCRRAVRDAVWLISLCLSGSMALWSCDTVSDSYRIGKWTLGTAFGITMGAAGVSMGTAKLVYRVGEFTFRVVMAPMDWPLTREEIESVDDLPPKEAIKQDRVKKAPYVVHGKRYVPMSVEAAEEYREVGTASWYGYETWGKKGGRMTANGEVFDPDGLNAAHKHLPLPTHVRVTNLENRRSIILRVNDRGPFVEGRIIDLSAGAAKRLGFYRKGTARVLVEAIPVEGS